mgnify:CR=1 FL=1
MWFEKLMEFEEISPENVREKSFVENNKIVSRINGKSYQFGKLEIPSLEELRQRTEIVNLEKGQIKVEEIIGETQDLHSRKENCNALFQVASQFNLLEMVGPHVTPERGIGIYENDYTQGPASAIACGAGTIFRNYFVKLDESIGQTSTNQIDCLDELGKALNNEDLKFWEMKNGYALCNSQGLLSLNKVINNLSLPEREKLKGKLKIGIQWDTEVTLSKDKQIANQIYCSALPVAYSSIEFFYWEQYARLILEATYEATFHAAMINLEKTGNNKVFLTLVGGGAFGNELDWILDSIEMAIKKFKSFPLDVKIVSYERSNNKVQNLINKFK